MPNSVCPECGGDEFHLCLLCKTSMALDNIKYDATDAEIRKRKLPEFPGSSAEDFDARNE